MSDTTKRIKMFSVSDQKCKAQHKVLKKYLDAVVHGNYPYIQVTSETSFWCSMGYKNTGGKASLFI